ncbi:MAG: IS66 family insertion sequence element accessory protein TnpB [Pseudomonadota bacterium]
MAQVALPNGLNANLVPKWRRQSGHGRTAVQPQLASGTFISLTLAPEPTPADADIRLELRRGPVAMSVSWPVAAAAHCAAWVREVLK